jgi:hypothetical protein
MHRILLVMLLGILVGCGSPLPQVELLIPVNAKCTTCEDFIRCEGTTGNAAVYDPYFDIYRLEPKGTLAQLATVWEFLIQLFYTRTEDVRPLSIYTQRRGVTEVFERSTRPNAEARIDLVRHRIYLPDGWIDQVTGERHGGDDTPSGSCRVLMPADGRELLKLFPEQAAGART